MNYFKLNVKSLLKSFVLTILHNSIAPQRCKSVSDHDWYVAWMNTEEDWPEIPGTYKYHCGKCPASKSE